MSEKLKTLRIIHFAICAGTILAYIVIGNISIDNLKNVPNIDSSSIVYIIIPVAAILVGNFLFKSQLKKIENNQKLEDNFALYQTASLIRWAILEGMAFFILFSKPDFVIFGILLIVYLVSLMPTEERIKNDLKKF
ncbi:MULTISPECIES: MFS transporter [Flavobacterium]|uniref:MFS transporter n=1 Tax=Flavobacterium hankyongi TaxID=1176532 RepID=A0ABP8ZJ96_9FLAO|nr:MFS transporter [Flavobacterium sp. N1846]